MTSASTRYVMIPGLGCDGRLWNPLRDRGLRIETPPWIAPKRREGLPDYAARLAATVDASTPFVLGGSSFGGFVALEMARHLPSRALVLLSSGWCDQAVRDWVRNLHPWLGWTPAPIFKPVAAMVIGSTLRDEPVTKEHHKLMFAMLGAIPAEFFKWAAQSVLGWTFDVGQPLPCPVYQLHGRHDRLMPVDRSRATHVVEDGGHLINLTHVDEVAAFLRQCGDGHAKPTPARSFGSSSGTGQMSFSPQPGQCVPSQMALK